MHCMETKYFEQGEDILMKGNKSDWFYIIKEGEVLLDDLIGVENNVSATQYKINTTSLRVIESEYTYM